MFAQLFVVPTGSNHGFHTAIVFVVAAALLLPPELVALVGLVQHGPEGVRKGYRWYIQAFNIANCTLNALAAWGAAHLVANGTGGDLRWALEGLAAAVALVALNHFLLAVILRLARGHRMRDTGLLSPRGLAMDLVLAGLGIGLATFWKTNPWLIPVVVAPLLMSHRSFSLLAALRESEERFRTMFESAAVGAALVDAEGSVVASNRALEEMLGREKVELAGRRLSDAVHEDDREDYETDRTALLAAVRDQARAERRYVAQDGSLVWGQLAAALVRDADGKPQFTIEMVQDISERRALEEQLRQAQKLEAVGRLAGGIAHDFNNMLTAIMGYARVVLTTLEGGEKVDPADIEEIVSAADRADALTSQLLAFSRNQVLQPQILDLNFVLRDLERLLGRLIGEDIEVVTQLAPDLGRVKADPSQLEQVIVNLVVNARDAMPNGGRLLLETANIEANGHGPYIELRVSDNGCGMDPETQARIFEPFFTTKGPGEGTGLGLSTAYGIVTQSGGSIEVESEPGEGTRYRILLPRVAAGLSEVGPERTRVRSLRGAETVLLVEDEAIVRKLVREILREHGYTVLEADGSDEALEICRRRRGPIDLVVTDVVMPRMSGPDLVRRLAPYQPRSRILYISGYTGGALLPEALPRAAGFLRKPFTPDRLARKVREVLDSYEPTSEVA